VFCVVLLEHGDRFLATHAMLVKDDKHLIRTCKLLFLLYVDITEADLATCMQSRWPVCKCKGQYAASDQSYYVITMLYTRSTVYMAADALMRELQSSSEALHFVVKVCDTSHTVYKSTLET
jgi:hypothetical protein